MRTVIRDARYSSAARRVHSLERPHRQLREPSLAQAYRRAWNQGKVRWDEIPAEVRPYV